MLGITGWALFSVLVAPLLVGLGAFASGPRTARRVGQLGALTAAGGFVVAAGLAVHAAGGSVATATVGPLELSADPLAVVLLLLVFGVSAIVQTFALRYLAGDPRATWFTGGAGLLTGAAAGMVTAGTLIGLAVFWTATGVALCLLLAMYRDLPAARDGVRRTVTAFVIGDLALWAAVGLATAAWGRIDLTAARAGQFGGPLLPLLACLVVVAALSRSAQIPFHRWLPATLAAPTPVSALLHAGVVNAGGILLIKTSFVFASSALATHIAFFAGAATAVYGTALMLSKPDVKGALAQSTTGQMGFMIMTCGLGAWVATLFHLLAHSMYKASLFLGSGSALSSESRRLRAPGPAAGGMPRAGRAIVSVLAPVPPLAGFAILLYPDPNPTSAALLAFAWATFAWITDGWLARSPGAKGLAGAASALTVASGLYVGLLSLASGFFSQNLAESGAATVSPAWLLVFVPVAALALAIRTGAVDALAGFRKTAYVALLNAGQVRRPGTGNRTPVRVPLRDSGAFRPSSQGARS